MPDQRSRLFGNVTSQERFSGINIYIAVPYSLKDIPCLRWSRSVTHCTEQLHDFLANRGIRETKLPLHLFYITPRTHERIE